MTSPKPPPAPGETQPGTPSQASGQKPTKSPREELDAIHNRYFQAVQDIWQHLQKRLHEHQKELHTSYQGLLQSAPAPTPGHEAQSKFLESQQDYLRGSQGVYDEALKRAADAYQEYLRAVQRELARTEAEQLDPPLVAAISQSMIMVACSAQHVRGPRAR